jgi:hypothetical protein
MICQLGKAADRFGMRRYIINSPSARGEDGLGHIFPTPPPHLSRHRLLPDTTCMKKKVRHCGNLDASLNLDQTLAGVIEARSWYSSTLQSANVRTTSELFYATCK